MRPYPSLTGDYIAQRFSAEALNSEDETNSRELPQAVCALEVEAGEPTRWLVDGLIPAAEPVLVVADGGVGKTTWAIALAGTVAGGYTLWDRPECRAQIAPVLLVSEEDDAKVLTNRLEALSAGHGWERGRVLGNVHVLALEGVQLAEARWQLHLLAEVERIGAGLVILDPLFELSGADEDSNSGQRPAVKFCRALIRRTGATMLVLHHLGKAGEGKRKIDRVRGASAWYGAARAVFALEERDDGIQVECLKMSRAQKPATHVLERAVITDAANPGTWLSATLRSRTLRAADLNHAQRWVLDQLRTAGERLTTTDLKKLAVGSGVSGADVGTALKNLEASVSIDFTPGNRGSKFWGLTLPGNVGKVAESTLPTLPDVCPARSHGASRPCPPLKGQGKVVGHGGQGEIVPAPAETS